MNTRRSQREERWDLLVVSHPCVLAVNQAPYAALQERGWRLRLAVPSRWRHEYAQATLRPASLPGMEGSLLPLPVALPGRVQRHVYLASPTKALRSLSPRVVFLEQETFSIAALQWGRAAWQAGIPFGVQAAENLDRPLPLAASLIRDRVLARADFVAARSPSAADLARHWGAKGLVPLVPHAVPRWPVGGSSKASGAAFTVGFAGRLVEQKGIADLVAACRLLGPPAELLVIGDGPLRPTLESATLPGKVRIWSDLPHERMPEAYAEMDVLVLPSRTTSTWAEQFGRVLVEALWCGVPVVGSDSGEIPWVVTATGGGRLFPEGDVRQLAKVLGELRSDPVQRQAFAELGRARVQKMFSVDASAEALHRTLTAVVHGSGRPTGGLDG
jgi:glycosyltransferase involved in cell wall biosynthesis